MTGPNKNYGSVESDKIVVDGSIATVDPTDFDVVESAIDALPVAGGTLYLTEGTYTWTGSASLDKEGLTVVGAGQAPTHLQRSGGGDVFTVDSDFVDIKNIRFTGDRSAGPHSALVVNSSNFTAENLRLFDWDKGIRITAGFEHSLTNVRGRNCVTSFVEADGANDLDMSMCFYDTNQDGTPEPDAGLDIIDMDAVQTEDCDFIHAGTGIRISPTMGNDSKWHKFEGGYLADSGDGSGVHITGSGTVRGVRFEGVWLATQQRGVLIDGTNTVESVIFSDCDIHNNENEGARVTNSNATDIRFDGCTFAGNDQANPGANDIYVDNVTDSLIQDNKFGDLFGWTSTPNANVFADTNASDVKIIGNDLGANTSGSAIVDNSGSAIIEDNIGWVTDNRVLSNTFAIDSTGLKSVTIAHGLDGTPNVEDAQLTVVEETDVNDWAYDFVKIVSADATNITAEVDVSTASGTGGATARLALAVSLE